MRELNTMETEVVSGAGVFSDAGKLLGEGIGAIVDVAKGSSGAASAGGALGQGIGSIVDGSLTLIGGIFDAIFKRS